MNINELSPELLVRIFSNIDDFSEKIVLEKVCKNWRRIVPLDWKITKTCPKPLNDRETLGLILNRCGEWLEELWLQNVKIDEKLVKQMAKRMKQLKHLKLSNCELNEPTMDTISDLFGHQLYSFVLDETAYPANIWKLIYKDSSKLEHLGLNSRNHSVGTVPIKLPNNLISFSLHNKFYGTTLMHLMNAARDCKNLKMLQLEIQTLMPDIIAVIGNIKSLVYLNLAVNSIPDELTLQNVICHELPNLKALNIRGNCSEETISNISQDRPDLVYLNVCARQTFQIPDSLNSLTLRGYIDDGILPETLLFQGNKSLKHLDIRYFELPSNLIGKLLGQYPDLKTIHCKMPATDIDLASFYLTPFFALIKKHLKKGRNITFFVHLDHQLYDSAYYYKYSLPGDLPQFETGWRAELCKEKCENLVLKNVIKEAIEGGNEPSFLAEWWME